MQTILGSSIGVFIAMTLLVAGFCAFMTGQAIAVTWRPKWQIYPYALLLGLANRFLVFAMFDGPLLSWVAYISNSLVLIVIAELAFRYARADKMITQYPWLYERDGPFSWRDRRFDEGIM